MIRRPPRSTLSPYPPLSRSRREPGTQPEGPDADGAAAKHADAEPAPDVAPARPGGARQEGERGEGGQRVVLDRKSTRLNSSHSQISYAVFCLKKKTK